MLRGQLQLRSWTAVAYGYVLAPLIGLTAWYLAPTLPEAFQPEFNFQGEMLGAFLVLVFGMPVCLAVELVLITPLLKAFNRGRIPWLNGWTGSGIGFLLGSLPWLLLGAFTPRTNPDQMGGIVGVTHSATIHAPDWVDNGHWTMAGWTHVFGEAASMGMIGLIAAVVFRIVAVRKKSETTP